MFWCSFLPWIWDSGGLFETDVQGWCADSGVLESKPFNVWLLWTRILKPWWQLEALPSLWCEVQSIWTKVVLTENKTNQIVFLKEESETLTSSFHVCIWGRERKEGELAQRLEDFLPRRSIVLMDRLKVNMSIVQSHAGLFASPQAVAH